MDFSFQSQYLLPSLPDGFSRQQPLDAARYSPDRLVFLDDYCFRTVCDGFPGIADVCEDYLQLFYLHKCTGKSTHD